MPLMYPIATSAKMALAAKAHARSQADAKRTIGGDVTLVSDWMRPTPAAYQKLSDSIENGLRDGYVQIYEAKGGKPVVAVTYWKRQKAAPAPSRPVEQPVREDHTDDLYFSKARKARPASRRRARPVDPRQMDLFVGPKVTGKEAPSPQNPETPMAHDSGAGDLGAASQTASQTGSDSTKAAK